MTKILIHSPCGGSGITTVTANLGVALARNGYPTLLVGRSEESVNRHFENWQPAIAQHEIPKFHAVRKVQIESQLFVKSDHPQQQTKAGFSGNVFDMPENPREFVLVESRCKELPSSDDLSQFQFLVLVAGPDASSFSEIANLFNNLCESSRPFFPAKLLVMLNHYNPESLLSRDIHYLFESSIHRYFYPEALLSDESVKEAVACGIPLCEHAPYSPVSRVLGDLAQNIIKWSDEIHAAA